MIVPVVFPAKNSLRPSGKVGVAKPPGRITKVGWALGSRSWFEAAMAGVSTSDSATSAVLATPPVMPTFITPFDSLTSGM